MEHLEETLRHMYGEIESKEIFLPLIISNAIICYKSAHNDEVYWENFRRKTLENKLNTIQDIYLFFIDFLPQTSYFERSYQKKVEHLKEFDTFLYELFCKQKYYYKHPEDFTKHLHKCITWIPNPKVWEFSQKIFNIGSNIRFSK